MQGLRDEVWLRVTNLGVMSIYNVLKIKRPEIWAWWQRPVIPALGKMR